MTSQQGSVGGGVASDDIDPDRDAKLEYLRDVAHRRGYVLPQYGLLANYDLPVLKAIDGITSSVYLPARGLARGVKELLFVISFTLQRMEIDEIANHVTMAVENGIPAQHVLEAIELLIPHAGIPTFNRALEAWAKATSAQRLDVALAVREGGLLDPGDGS